MAFTEVAREQKERNTHVQPFDNIFIHLSQYQFGSWKLVLVPNCFHFSFNRGVPETRNVENVPGGDCSSSQGTVICYSHADRKIAFVS